MTKPDLIQLLRLLSALESAMLTGGNKVPDYLLEQLSISAEMLEAEILK